jgi:ferritin-like metal-binding protein YciE
VEAKELTMSFLNPLKLTSMHSLLTFKIKTLYDCELRLTEALAQMSTASTSAELTAALDEHCEETKQQVARLETVCGLLGFSPDRETCVSMKSLIEEANMVIKAEGEDDVRDAALIAVCQAIEHHEIAAYGTARTWAREIQREDVASLLQETLDEESSANKMLTTIAESGVNAEAAHH